MTQPSPRDWERIARLAKSEDQPRDPFGDRGDHLPLPEYPVDLEPGSAEKLDALIARVQGPRPTQLFHPDERSNLQVLRAAYRMVKVDNGHNYGRELFAADLGGLDDYYDVPYCRLALELAGRLTSLMQAYRLALTCWGVDAWVGSGGGRHQVGVLRFPRPEEPALRCLTYGCGETWLEAFADALADYPTRKASRHQLTRMKERLTGQPVLLGNDGEPDTDPEPDDCDPDLDDERKVA